MKYIAMATGVLTGVLATSAQAAVINGGFEEGLDNWEAIGEVEVVDAEAFLSTASEGDIGVSGDAVTISELAEFIGSFPDFAQQESIDGSAIQTTFSSERGNSIAFSWNFLTDEAVNVPGYEFNDYAFAVLESETSSEAYLLSDTINPAFADEPETTTEFFNETGLQTFSAPIEAGVEYTLSIGVVDVVPAGAEDEPQLISGLIVDDFEAVPEGTPTLGLLLLGMSGAVLAFKRRKKIVL